MKSETTVGELHGSVLAALGAGIVAGHYQAGRALTLDGISAAHGVSRSVAREAIRVLESMGMVTPRRRVGLTIQPSSKWNVLDPRVIRWRLENGDRTAQLRSLAELRRGIEPAAAALAALRADPQQCRSMAAAVSDMVVHGRSGDLEGFRLADKLFHRTLLEASRNEMFCALYEVVAEVLGDPAPSGGASTRADAAVVALHDEVARAVRLRDAGGAERAMRAIIDSSVSAEPPA